MTVTQNPDRTFTLVPTAEERAALDEAVVAQLIPRATPAEAVQFLLAPRFAAMRQTVREHLIRQIDDALPAMSTQGLRALAQATPDGPAARIEFTLGPITDIPIHP